MIGEAKRRVDEGLGEFVAKCCIIKFLKVVAIARFHDAIAADVEPFFNKLAREVIVRIVNSHVGCQKIGEDI